MKSYLGDLKPDVVFNCAAWTDVDGCESDPKRAERANALGPQLLAATCRDIGALLITISTDYVFDGAKEGFYTQRDHPNPISVYGRFKLDGERRAQTAYARTIVVRSGYIFGAGGTNFLSTVLDRARRSESLRAISDMAGTPTYAPDLAARLRELAELDLPGNYHVVNSGDGVSFEGFARTALAAAALDPALLQSSTLAELKRPAPRPHSWARGAGVICQRRGNGVRYPTSSRIACFTWAGTGAYFSGSITLLARPWLIERSSVV